MNILCNPSCANPCFLHAFHPETNYLDSRTPEERANEPTTTVTTATSIPEKKRCCPVCTDGNENTHPAKHCAYPDCVCHTPPDKKCEHDAERD